MEYTPKYPTDFKNKVRQNGAMKSEWPLRASTQRTLERAQPVPMINRANVNVKMKMK